MQPYLVISGHTHKMRTKSLWASASFLLQYSLVSLSPLQPQQICSASSRAPCSPATGPCLRLLSPKSPAGLLGLSLPHIPTHCVPQDSAQMPSPLSKCGIFLLQLFLGIGHNVLIEPASLASGHLCVYHILSVEWRFLCG